MSARLSTLFKGLSKSDKFWYLLAAVVMGAAGYCWAIGLQVAVGMGPFRIVGLAFAIGSGYGFLRFLFYRLTVRPSMNLLKSRFILLIFTTTFLPLFVAGLSYMWDKHVDWIYVSIIVGVITVLNGIELLVRYALRSHKART